MSFKISKRAFLAIGIFPMLIGCATIDKNQGIINGRVVSADGNSLPKSAVVQIALEDVSIMDASSVRLGGATLSGYDKFPLQYSIKYDKTKITIGRRYTISVRIEDNGKLIYWSDTHTPVFNEGAPSDNIDVNVVKTR